MDGLGLWGDGKRQGLGGQIRDLEGHNWSPVAGGRGAAGGGLISWTVGLWVVDGSCCLDCRRV